jgi:hypothetical protein
MTAKRFRKGHTDARAKTISATIEAICLLDGQSALPQNVYSHRNIQRAHLSYIRNAHLWKEIDIKVLSPNVNG